MTVFLSSASLFLEICKEKFKKSGQEITTEQEKLAFIRHAHNMGFTEVRWKCVTIPLWLYSS